MKTNQHITVGWFEISVKDMDSAQAFYESVFDTKLMRNQMGPLDMAWFPWDESGRGAGGSLVAHKDFYHPSKEGTLVYFSSDDVSIELSRVEAAGGKILQTKKEIAPDVGYMALFIDSEGNRIALHSKR